MTTPQLGLTTLHPTRPFLTLPLFKAQPTGLATDALVPGGTPQQQDAQLARIIERASREMNLECYGASGGVLHATSDTETVRVRMNRQGKVVINPRLTPVLALTSLSWGMDQGALSQVTDLSHADIELTRIEVPLYPFTGMSSAGPLQLGPVTGPGGSLRVIYSYISGWPLTSLANPAATGATSVTVADATGIYVGTVLTIRDPVAGDESFAVTSVNGAVLGCPALQHDHAGGVQIDALPGDLIDACTEITTGLLKRRAQETVKTTNARGKSSAAPGEEPTAPGEDNFARGYELLSHYVQVRTR